MKAVICIGPGKIAVQDVPMPLIEPDEALVQIEACAVCNGTDSAIVEGVFPFMPEDPYPFILGHESVGTIVEIGEAVVSFAAGNRVLRPMARSVSVQAVWGGMAEYGVVVDAAARQKRQSGWRPDGMILAQQVVPDTIGPEECTVLITLKETLAWLEKVDFRPGESVLILGSGPVAMSLAFWCCLGGGKPVVLAGRNDKTLKRASRFGADGTMNTSNPMWTRDAWEWAMGRGFDLIADTTGRPDLIVAASELLSKTGRTGLYGIIKKGESLDARALKGEWRLFSLSPEEWRAHDRVVRAVELGSVSPRSFITHALPMAQAERALALVASRDAIKVVIRMA